MHETRIPKVKGHIDSVDRKPNGIYVRGWICPLDRRTPYETKLLVDGIEMPIASGMDRSDVAKVYFKKEKQFGFQTVFPITASTAIVLIKNENDVNQALGSPTKKALFQSSTKGGYWEYPEIGLTVYFREEQNVKNCDLSISYKTFTGEVFVGKSKLDRETHIYKLLQFNELNFKSIEIEPIPEDPSNFHQFIKVECYGKGASFIYFRTDAIGLLSIDLY